MLPPHSTTVNLSRSVPEGIISASDSGTYALIFPNTLTVINDLGSAEALPILIW